MAEKILGVEWRAGVVGIVAVQPDGGVYHSYSKDAFVPDGWVAYIGVGKGYDIEADTAHVRLYGSRLSVGEAMAFFPELDMNKYGKEG